MPRCGVLGTVYTQFERLVTIIGTGSLDITSQQSSRVFYLIVRVRGWLSPISVDAEAPLPPGIRCSTHTTRRF